MITVQQLIDRYSLQPHPEGGWYAETYRSDLRIPVLSSEHGSNAERNCSTAIYFLLESGNFSAFHRIRSDECWHFYAGGPLDIYEFTESGQLIITPLGADLKNGSIFQYVVKAGRWFASRPANGTEFSFVGCTVSPGFDFADFELADSAKLTARYPQYSSVIHELTR